jgi:hypothetical protein
MRWIRNTLDKILGRFSVLGGLFKYLWANKMWWLIPMVAVLAVAGVILLLAQTTPLGVFIYTIF